MLKPPLPFGHRHHGAFSMTLEVFMLLECHALTEEYVPPEEARDLIDFLVSYNINKWSRCVDAQACNASTKDPATGAAEQNQNQTNFLLFSYKTFYICERYLQRF